MNCIFHIASSKSVMAGLSMRSFIDIPKLLHPKICPSIGFMSRVKRIVHTSLLIVSSLLVSAVILLASPLGRVIDRALTMHFIAMNGRRAHHRLSRWDGIQCQLLYNSIATGGRLISPEAGQIIWHYFHGHGSDLWLNSDYIRKSPVIQHSLAQLRDGQSRQFGFRQAEDWRLSYAVNPFSLKRSGGNALMWQLMKFETRPGTLTTLNYGIGKFQLPDALIYSMHPRTYTVYSEWKI